MALTGQIPGPVHSKLLISKTIDNRAHETRDDVDNQEEYVTNLQTEAGKEGDESSLKGRNHKGEQAQQQLKQEDRNISLAVIMKLSVTNHKTV